MSNKEIKAALKAAREAIDKKEYQDALKHCKTVLRLDKSHSTALVFAGVAASELQQFDQAHAAFTKATNSSPDLPIVWQGLADFCVKQKDEKYHKDLTLCYERLSAIYENKDPGKFCDFAEKHGDAWLLREQPLQALACWQGALEKLNDFPTEVIEAKEPALCQKVANVITSQLPVDYEHIALLSRTSCRSGEEGRERFALYLLRVLQVDDDEVINQCRAQVMSLLTEQCQSLRTEHPGNVMSRHLICMLALASKERDCVALSDEESAVCCELAELRAGHPTVKLCNAFSALLNGNIPVATDEIGQALSQCSGCPLTWCISAKVQLRLHAYDEACSSARQGLCCVGSPQSKEYLIDVGRLSTSLQLCQIHGLLDENREQFEDAINLCHDVMKHEGSNPGVQLLLAKAYVLNGDVTQAGDICEDVLREDRSNHFALFVQSLAEAACEHFRSAEENVKTAIQLSPSVSEYHLHYGCMLSESQESEKQQEAFSCFMTAARLDPLDSRPFYKLGVFYADTEKNLSKALRCFQKSVELNSSNVKAVARLGDCYQAQGLMTEALELYQRLTISMPVSQAHVAWSRLGALQLDAGHSQEAIASLQTALRSNPRDPATWEALGTAYMDRGSYSSALKALLRSVQLANSTYGLCKIADIKNKIGLNSEAIDDYRRVLEMDEEYLPALTGLSEACFRRAESCMEKNFDLTAVHCVGEVLSALARAVSVNPKLMSLWKLLGDACQLLTPLPLEVVKCLQLPAFFSPTPQVASKCEIFTLASRAYVQALHTAPDQQYHHWLWHDLAVNYHEQMKEEVSGSRQQELAQEALKAIQNAIRLQKSEASHWNTLGVFCAHPSINRFALAQHAFIKTLQLHPDNAGAWSNLGALYIAQNNIELAHRAFAKAQAVDPEYTGGWLGQAMVAEFMQHEETQDLYHHAAELSYHSQAALGLGHFVCSSLVDAPPLPTSLAAESTGTSPVSDHKVPADFGSYCSAEDIVADLLEKVSRRHPENNSALSMLGIILERRKLYTLAEQAYASVCRNLESVQASQTALDIALANHARALCLCGRYSDAVKRFPNISKLRLEDCCWWALSCFHDNESVKNGTCMQVFEKAIQSATLPRDRSAIFAAAAMAAYRAGDAEKCKMFLLKSSQEEPCPEGLCALTAMAILQKDVTLIKAAVVELRKASIRDVSLRASRTYIESVYCVLSGEKEVGCRKWWKEIHQSPGDGEFWSEFGRFMIQTMVSVDKFHQVAKTATLLKPSLAPATQLVSALGHLSAGQSQQTALYAAQKAIYSSPTSAYAWSCLAACVATRSKAPRGDPEAGGGNSDDARERQLGRETPMTDSLISMCYGKVKEAVVRARSAPSANVEHTEAKSLQALESWMTSFSHLSRLRSGCKDVPAADAQLFSSLPPGHRIRLLSLLSEAGQLSAAGKLNQAQLAAVRSMVLANGDFTLGLQSLAQCYNSAGLPVAAELTLRYSAAVAGKTGGNPAASLLRLAHLGLQHHVIGVEPDRWLKLAQEALHAGMQFCRQSFAAQVLQALVTYHAGNAKYAAKLLDSLLTRYANHEVSDVLQYYSLKAQLKLKGYDKAKVLLEGMKQTGSAFHLPAFQLFQSLS